MKIQHLDSEHNLPDFLIVGAAKSGTTSLHYYLKQISNIFVPETKESYFFSFYKAQPNFISPDPLFDVISDLEKYAKQFIDVPNGHLIGDASPSYLYSYKTTINNIKEIYGERYRNLKIIILLRNPVDRAWSQYMHFKKNYNEPLDFSNAIQAETIENRLKNNWNYFYDYKGFGLYTNQVKAYIDNFDQVKVFLYDDLKKDSNLVLSKTLKFLQLNIENQKDNNQNKKVFNISGVPKKNIYSLFWRLKKIRGLKYVVRKMIPVNFRNKINNFLMSKSLQRATMEQIDRDVLNEFYKNEVLQLYELLKREEIKKW